MPTKEIYINEKINLLKRKNSSHKNKNKLLFSEPNLEKPKKLLLPLSMQQENFIKEKILLLNKLKGDYKLKKVQKSVKPESILKNIRNVNEIEERLMLKVLTDNMILLTAKKLEKSERENKKLIKHLEEKVVKQDFIRSSINTLNRKSFEKKYEDHFVKNTPIMLVADLARSLPKQSLEPKLIWTKFFNKL